MQLQRDREKQLFIQNALKRKQFFFLLIYVYLSFSIVVHYLCMKIDFADTPCSVKSFNVTK